MSTSHYSLSLSVSVRELQIAAEVERKNIRWQAIRKNLKREYNRDRALYDAQLAVHQGQRHVHYSVTGSDSSSMLGEQPGALPPPVEADYAELEEQYFGALSLQLEKLSWLHVDVNVLTERAIRTLRYACVNISQKSAIIESLAKKSQFVPSTAVDTTENPELNLWVQLVMWLEAQFCSHETGSAL